MDEQRDMYLEQLITELLEQYDMEEVLGKLCSRAYDRLSVYKALGDKESIRRWDKISDMLDLALSNIS